MNNYQRDLITELLIIQLKAGNVTLANDLVKLWQKKFLKDAFYLVKDLDLAADIVQDSWIVILAKIHSLRDPRAFMLWSRRIIYNKCMDHLRKNSVKELPDIVDSNEPDNREDAIRKIISVLPTKEKQLVRWYYYDQLAVSDIAHILGVPNGTIKSRLYHLRIKIKKQLTLINYEKR